MRFLRLLADFLSALAFLWCHYIFDSYVTCLTLSFIYYTHYICVIPFILIFGASIVLNSPYFGRIQIDLKDTHRKKNTLKQNSNAFEKYEYGYLGGWYIKSTLYTRFLNWHKIFENGKLYRQNSVLCDRSILHSSFYLS